MRQAVLIVYLLEIAWLIVPPILDGMCRCLFPAAYLWFGPINDWVLATSPLALVYLGAVDTADRCSCAAAGWPRCSISSVWMVGLQLALGVFFLIVAVWQLRPTFRRQEESTRRLFGARSKLRRPRWLSRPECGADAMLWKERHFARTDFFTKLVVLPATILLTVCVLLAGRFDEMVVHSFADVWQRGYSSFSHERTHFNETLCAISPIYMSLWLLAVAGASASAVTLRARAGHLGQPDREPALRLGDPARQGRRGDLGPARFRRPAEPVLAGGARRGGDSPARIAARALVVGLLTWFVLALGIRASLSARKTSRALTITIAILVFLNLGYLAVVYPILQVVRDPYESQQYVMIGCTPLIAAVRPALVSAGGEHRSPACAMAG